MKSKLPYPLSRLDGLTLRDTLENSKFLQGPRKPELLPLPLLHMTLGLDVLGMQG